MAKIKRDHPKLDWDNMPKRDQLHILEKYIAREKERLSELKTSAKERGSTTESRRSSSRTRSTLSREKEEFAKKPLQDFQAPKRCA